MKGGIDFSSALYLGFCHAHGSLRPWHNFTTGKPIVLGAPPETIGLKNRVAGLLGAEKATFAKSTLHLFWDLFGIFPPGKVKIYLDSGAYPVVRWGVERAAARGIKTKLFQLHDAEDLFRQISHNYEPDVRPVVVTDGLCPGCPKNVPLQAYLEIVRSFQGFLIIDDTQAVGILGQDPNLSSPFGVGGGGSLRWRGLTGPDIVLICSMAKGLGSPLATLASSRHVVRAFERMSQTRVHLSPPSVADLRALEHALDINKKFGDFLRQRLLDRTRRFRYLLKNFGISLQKSLFPVQTLHTIPGLDARILHKRLLHAGIQTILHQIHNKSAFQITFVLTALHEQSEIDMAARKVLSCIRGCGGR